MYISYICQTFLHYFLTCFPITTNPNSPKKTHTQLPFTKSLHELLAHFLWAWPQTQRVQLGVQSNCNQCWIAFPPFPPPKKKATRLFGFFLSVSRLKCERLRNQWHCQRKTHKRCLQISKCHFCFRLLSRARGQEAGGKRKAIKLMPIGGQSQIPKLNETNRQSQIC